MTTMNYKEKLDKLIGMAKRIGKEYKRDHLEILDIMAPLPKLYYKAGDQLEYRQLQWTTMNKCNLLPEHMKQKLEKFAADVSFLAPNNAISPFNGEVKSWMQIHQDEKVVDRIIYRNDDKTTFFIADSYPEQWEQIMGECVARFEMIKDGIKLVLDRLTESDLPKIVWAQPGRVSGHNIQWGHPKQMQLTWDSQKNGVVFGSAVYSNFHNGVYQGNDYCARVLDISSEIVETFDKQYFLDTFSEKEESSELDTIEMSSEQSEITPPPSPKKEEEYSETGSYSFSTETEKDEGTSSSDSDETIDFEEDELVEKIQNSKILTNKTLGSILQLDKDDQNDIAEKIENITNENDLSSESSLFEFDREPIAEPNDNIFEQYSKAKKNWRDWVYIGPDEEFSEVTQDEIDDGFLEDMDYVNKYLRLCSDDEDAFNMAVDALQPHVEKGKYDFHPDVIKEIIEYKGKDYLLVNKKKVIKEVKLSSKLARRSFGNHIIHAMVPKAHWLNSLTAHVIDTLENEYCEKMEILNALTTRDPWTITVLDGQTEYTDYQWRIRGVRTKVIRLVKYLDGLYDVRHPISDHRLCSVMDININWKPDVYEKIFRYKGAKIYNTETGKFSNRTKKSKYNKVSAIYIPKGKPLDYDRYISHLSYMFELYDRLPTNVKDTVAKSINFMKICVKNKELGMYTSWPTAKQHKKRPSHGKVSNKWGFFLQDKNCGTSIIDLEESFDKYESEYLIEKPQYNKISNGQYNYDDKPVSRYWLREGLLQKEYDELFREIEISGHAKDSNGEMLRVVSRMIYRLYNDGDDPELTYNGSQNSNDNKGCKDMHITLKDKEFIEDWIYNKRFNYAHQARWLDDFMDATIDRILSVLDKQN